MVILGQMECLRMLEFTSWNSFLAAKSRQKIRRTLYINQEDDTIILRLLEHLF